MRVDHISNVSTNCEKVVDVADSTISDIELKSTLFETSEEISIV